MNGSGQPGTQGGRRPPANALTMENTRLDFDAAWREVKPRIESLLRSRGVKNEVVDDVAQETAIKLFHNWGRVDPDRPLWPLARTIALNCLVDQFRGRSADPVGVVPDAPDPYDLEEHGLARARLSAVGSVMRSLRPKDRSLLLAEIQDDGPAGNTSAHKMARLRARQRLNQALERSAASFGAVPLLVRRAAVWLQTASSSGDAYGTALAGVAVAAALAASSVSPGGDVSVAPRGDEERRAMRAVGARFEHRRSGGDGKAVPAAAKKRAGRRDAVATATQPPAPATPEPAAPPAPPEERERDVAEAQGKRAETGSGKGYQYVAVCDDNEPDPALSVTYNDGTQDDDEEYEHCDD